MDTAQHLSHLNQLLDIARDGEEFYKEAAEQAGSPPVRGFFIEQAQVRRHLIDELAGRLVQSGEQPSNPRVKGSPAWSLYARVLAAVRADNEPVYIKALEKAEDRLIEPFRLVLDEPTAPGVKPVLKEFLEQADAAHERMEQLTHT